MAAAGVGQRQAVAGERLMAGQGNRRAEQRLGAGVKGKQQKWQ